MPASIEPAPEVEGATLTTFLGRGGFASVWAFASPTHPGAAIKIANHATDLAIERFELEARALRAIGAPTVPELYDHGRLPDGRPYLLMERLGGRSLGSVLAQLPAPLPWETALEIARGLLSALESVHATGLVHRDLKPENVFLPPSAPIPVRLIDLGLCVEAGHPSPGDAVVGTIDYMAPEQLKGGIVDARADLYAFGAVVFELLTLRPPFVGDPATIEHGHASLRPPRPRELVALPAALESVLLACLAKLPEDRPRDVAEVRRMLELVRAQAPVIVSAPEGHAQLAGSHEPAVLLFAEAHASAAADGVAATATAHRGVLVKRRGRRLLFVFSAERCEHPLRAAIAAGREISTAARTVIHLATLQVRHGDRGSLMAFGEALDRPERWLPADWQGLLVTTEVASSLPPHATRAGPDRWFTLYDEAEGALATLALVGRDEELARLDAAIDHASATGSSALLSVIGESGSGTSRLFAELRARATADTIAISGHAREQLARSLGLTSDRGGAHAFARDAAAALTERARHRPLLVLLDDAHRAEPAVLDALEYVASDVAAVALVIGVFADSRLTSIRPSWGARAVSHVRIDLAPLATAAAMSLAAEALLPAEYVPRDVLAQLAASSGGNPGLLLGVIGELKRQGAVRHHPNGSGWLLSTELVDAIGRSPADRWLASRAIADMTPDLAALVRVCSVIGIRFAAHEVAAVQHELERMGAASSRIDPGIGLDALCDAGILDRQGADLGFRLPLIQSALAEQLDAGDRRNIHAAAVAYWKARTDGLEALAVHASGADLHEEAASAHLVLAARSSTQHRDLDADRHFTAAMRHLRADDAAARMRALVGRAKARMRLHRLTEASSDLEAARSLARADELAAILLDHAMVLDWAEDYPGAERCIAEAAALGATSTPRAWLAQGCAAWRRGDAPRAVDDLLRATRDAADTETRIVAGVLLGPALVVAGRLDDAEASFTETIARATEDDDRLHLCAAHANRLFLWSARHRPDRAIEDLDMSARLAREIGHAALERIATHNLAELLYWTGDLVESRRLAQRSRSLQERFGDKPTPEDALLLARIDLARSDLAAARQHLDWIAAHRSSEPGTPTAQALERAVRLVLEGADEATWQEVVATARASLPPEEADEVERWHDVATRTQPALE